MLHVGLDVGIHRQRGIVNAGEQIGFWIMYEGSRFFQTVEHILDVMAVDPEKLFLHQPCRNHVGPESEGDPVGQQGADDDPHDFVHFLLAVVLTKSLIAHLFLDDLPQGFRGV